MARRGAGRDERIRRGGRIGRGVSRLGAALALSVLGYLGGVAATNLLPAHASTPFYQAGVHLSPIPDSTLEAPTLLGTVRVHFDSPLPAPRIVVAASIRPGIEAAFTSGTPTPATFKPSDAQISHAISTTIDQLAVRFVGGFVITVLALVGAHRLAGRRRLGGYAAPLAVAVVLGVAGPAAAGVLAYRTSNVTQISATSLLGIVQRNSGLLTDIQERTAESSRYVSSALGVAAALQDTFKTQHEDAPVAVRVLFVSDIHGINQYAVMKSIVDSEHVDVVVDSGDLINFGHADEATASSLLQGIASLGIPYLFIRGNHDASAAHDYSLLNRLAKVPNVVLLQPGPTHYVRASIAGVSFGGFNDPRFYGDGKLSDQPAQLAAREKFASAYAGLDFPDVVISHEPGAVKGMNAEASLLVDGHTHVPALDGNRMTVGTFTGGGLFGARLAQGAESGTEVQTGTYSFDVATFDTTCSLSTVRRYTFNGILQGDPNLKSASILSGSSIVPPAKDRTCGGSTSPDLTDLSVQKGSADAG